MMNFMGEDFLLSTSTSKKLYHDYAEKCPVIDFDNYLSAQDIFQHRTYKNLTELWIDADPSKQEVMRIYGVDELYITGVAVPYEKFMKFAEVVPKLIGSPVYHGVHLELRRIFGIFKSLNSESAPEIWKETETVLKEENYNVISMLEKLGVKAVSTAVSPGGDLEWHLRCAHSEKVPFKVLPSFCPDIIMNIDRPAWFSGITELGKYGVIHDWESLKAVMSASLDDFCKAGCIAAEHGYIPVRSISGDPDPVVEKMIHEGNVTSEEADIFCGALMRFLDEEYAARNIIKLQEESLGGIGHGVQHVRGISMQIEELMEKGILAFSVGMLTDAHSVTSMVRHEYYRRILCEKIGQLVESGQYPNDIEFLGEMVQDICWRNAVEYFGF